MKMRSPAFDAKGFTLIEMAVVMVVAVILLSIAVPSFTTMISSQRVSSAASELQMDLMLARNEAIKRAGSITVESSPSWSEGWEVKSGTTVVSKRQVPAGLSIAGSTVTFNSRGRANAVNFSVTGENDVVRCVSVGAAGSVTIKKEACS